MTTTFLTVTQAASRLDVSTQTMSNMGLSGRVRRKKINGRWLYNADDVHLLRLQKKQGRRMTKDEYRGIRKHQPTLDAGVVDLVDQYLASDDYKVYKRRYRGGGRSKKSRVKRGG